MQYVEYVIGHYLDKMAENLFGFLSVLPGAFATFRVAAVKGQPLEKFLKPLVLKDKMTCYQANKALAEDRIFCPEITFKVDGRYKLGYFNSAVALTDPPYELLTFIKQRRRWFNGSFFSSVHVLLSMRSLICRSRHRRCTKALFLVLYLYLVVQQAFSFLLVGMFYGTLSIFLRAVLPSGDCLQPWAASNLLENLYLVLLLLFTSVSATIHIS